MNNHWGPLPDCYCCFHTSHTSSLSASQIPPPHFVDIILHLSHHHFPSPNFSPTFVSRSLVCSPLHTLHQTGRKTRVGFGAETSCSAHRLGLAPRLVTTLPTKGRRLHGSMPAVTPPTYFGHKIQSGWKLPLTFLSCTFYCSVHRYI